MKWTPQQDAALRTVAEWYKDPSQQVCRVFGYAGTGKTTLARHFAEGIDGLVLYGAYTGKAAYVMRRMGCAGASTIHRLIYHSKEKGRARLKELEQSLAELRMMLRSELAPDEPADKIDTHREVVALQERIREERRSLSQPMFTINPESTLYGAKLVIIDECSMVDGRMGEDLLSFGAKVLVLGDPAQLPPVAGGGFFTEVERPEVMLTDVRRQARDNPIIHMATMTREEKPLPLGMYGNSEVTERRIEPHEALKADQVLVGRNKTRHASNQRLRSLLGRNEPLPVPEDKLVCLRNNDGKGLLNGAIWYVEDVGILDPNRIVMSIRPEIEEELPIDVEAHTHHFLGQESELPWWDRKEAEEFGYGYAMTVHKAQGSQWENVLLFDEAWCFRKDRWRWLYTGLTRAADRVTVARM